MNRLLFCVKNQSDFSAGESQENLANLAKAFGAAAIESCAAVFELKGNQYLLCMDTIRYGDLTDPPDERKFGNYDRHSSRF